MLRIARSALTSNLPVPIPMPRSKPEKLRRFYDQFSGNDHVLIVINADPDAIGSAMAIRRLLCAAPDGIIILFTDKEEASALTPAEGRARALRRRQQRGAGATKSPQCHRSPPRADDGRSSCSRRKGALCHNTHQRRAGPKGPLPTSPLYQVGNGDSP